MDLSGSPRRAEIKLSDQPRFFSSVRVKSLIFLDPQPALRSGFYLKPNFNANMLAAPDLIGEGRSRASRQRRKPIRLGARIMAPSGRLAYRQRRSRRANCVCRLPTTRATEAPGYPWRAKNGGRYEQECEPEHW